MDLVDVLVEAGSDMEAICEVSILSVIVHKICYIPYFRLFSLLGLLPLQAFLQQTLLFFDTTCQMPHFILPIEKESAHFRSGKEGISWYCPGRFKLLLYSSCDYSGE